MHQDISKLCKVIFFIILLTNTSSKTNKSYQKKQQQQNKDKQYSWNDWLSNINIEWLITKIISYISKAGFKVLVTPGILRAQIKIIVQKLVSVSLKKAALKKIPLVGGLIGVGLGAWRTYNRQYGRAALQVLSGLAGATGLGILYSLSIDILILILDVIEQLQKQNIITGQRYLEFKSIQKGQIQVIDLKTTSFQTLQSPNLNLSINFKSLNQRTLLQITANYCHQNVCNEIQCPAGLTKVNKIIKKQMNSTQTIDLTFQNQDCNQGEGIYKVILKFAVKQDNWKEQTVVQFTFNLTDLNNPQSLVQYVGIQQLSTRAIQQL